jgi:hypothetical protein
MQTLRHEHQADLLLCVRMISPARDEYRCGHPLAARPALVGTAARDKRNLDDTVHQELRIPYRKESRVEGTGPDNADGWTTNRDVQTRRVVCTQDIRVFSYAGLITSRQ